MNDKRILIIEDEPEHIMIVQARLKKDGYSVSGAENGEAGIEKAKSEKPDLILLDVLLPGIDGVEVCRRLKADPATESIPILVVTALGTKDLHDKCLAAGAADILLKPWDAKELEEKIRGIIAS
jgi:CheY-like chemotaxis protein